MNFGPFWPQLFPEAWDPAYPPVYLGWYTKNQDWFSKVSQTVQKLQNLSNRIVSDIRTPKTLSQYSQVKLFSGSSASFSLSTTFLASPEQLGSVSMLTTGGGGGGRRRSLVDKGFIRDLIYCWAVDNNFTVYQNSPDWLRVLEPHLPLANLMGLSTLKWTCSGFRGFGLLILFLVSFFILVKPQRPRFRANIVQSS